MRWIRSVSLMAPVLAVSICGLAAAQDDSAFGKVAKHKMMALEELAGRTGEWLATTTLDQAQRDKVLAALTKEPAPATGTEMLARFCQALAEADVRVRGLLEVTNGPVDPTELYSADWLKDESTHALLKDNLRLVYGRWLCQERLYDEAADQLSGVAVENSIDPASLYFYQSVAYHRLLDKKRGLESIEKLLQDVQDTPRRYASLAALMVDDLAGLKDDSLDHISRRMEDVERRLDLGRAGKRVRTVEDGIVKSLDKLIEELEKQQQQQSGSAGALQPTQPAQQSRILGGQGPGNVDKKNVAATKSWGDLPPKKREEALQQIPKNFPSHYRDIIEQYFRRSTQEESAEPQK
jgi:hypothetical protein